MHTSAADYVPLTVNSRSSPALPAAPDAKTNVSIFGRLEDLERGDLTRAQAIDAIQRASQRVLKLARAAKKGARRRSGGTQV